MTRQRNTGLINETQDNWKMKREETTTANKGLVKWRLTRFYDIFVVNPTGMLLSNYCAHNPPS
ncbi:MAG TPA: hypothetical protein VI704_05055 [Bacteroidota bacterium]|nr:hypothetical protein [Bacteroidota bacterium]